MTIVVTGATGFVGTALIRRLTGQGERVLAVGGPRSGQVPKLNSLQWLPYGEDYQTTAHKIADSKPTSVIHCVNHFVMTRTVSDIHKAIEANIRFGSLLLGAIADMPVHFVNLSTFFQHQGPTGQQPNSFYAVSKKSFADVARWFSDSSQIDVCDLMLFDTYGPWDKRRKLIPRLLESAATGALTDIETPSAELNLTFIDDVISGIVDVVSKRTVGSWSLKAKGYVKVSEVVDHVESVTGRKVVDNWGDSQPQNSPRVEVAPTLRGWRPLVSLRSGIEQCWQTIG